MLLPLLSAKDPAASAEGTLDPLGLYQIADALGVKLIPGIRERMSHPRYLTLTAVSAAVCGEFDEETVAADDVSSPHQVFEWHVVEGLVRCIEDNKRLAGLPGRDKVGEAIDDVVPVSARRYLKTPTVFGFHGIYRLLARTLDIESEGRLGEAGYRLLDVWRTEQDLPGFCDSRSGKGADVLRLWRDAVRDGLAEGKVARSPSWQGWQRIADHLGPHEAGPKERRILAALVLESSAGHTRDLVGFMRSQAGKDIVRGILERKRQEGVGSERSFHIALRAGASAPMKSLLDAIDAYEAFARLLQDAFDECLLMMSKRKGKTPTKELVASKLVAKAAKDVSGAFGRAADALAPVGQSAGFLDAFQFVAESMPAGDWVQRLLEHHRRVQLAKPPNGKLPWLERFDDGTYVVRTDYQRDEGGRGDDSYVHAYRLGPLWSFASDLGMV